ncbi:MAG: hypothetical protein AAF492_16320 [Verrucomicrobiota bacterium]
MQNRSWKQQTDLSERFAINGSAFAVVVILYFMIDAMQVLLHSRITHLIHAHGIWPHLILFFTVRHGLLYFKHRRGTLGTAFKNRYLVGAAWPIMLGLVGLWWGLSHKVTGYTDYYAGANDLIAATEVLRQLCIGHQVPWDAALFGLMGTIAGLAFYVRLFVNPQADPPIRIPGFDRKSGTVLNSTMH